MLQILGRMRGWNSKMLQNTVKMAASSSKMLQIARETDGTGDPKKNIKTEINNSQNNSGLVLKGWRNLYTLLVQFGTMASTHRTWLQKTKVSR